jgi:hypothetical protein
MAALMPPLFFNLKLPLIKIGLDFLPARSHLLGNDLMRSIRFGLLIAEQLHIFATANQSASPGFQDLDYIPAKFTLVNFSFVWHKIPPLHCFWRL